MTEEEKKEADKVALAQGAGASLGLCGEGKIGGLWMPLAACCMASPEVLSRRWAQEMVCLQRCLQSSSMSGRSRGMVPGLSLFSPSHRQPRSHLTC